MVVGGASAINHTAEREVV